MKKHIIPCFCWAISAIMVVDGVMYCLMSIQPEEIPWERMVPILKIYSLCGAVIGVAGKFLFEGRLRSQ